MKSFLKKFLRMIKKMLGKEVYVVTNNIYPTQLLFDKNIVVTGGSGGIGYAIAKQCLQQGAKVIITGTNNSKLEVAVKSLSQYGDVYGCKWDIADVKQIEEKFEEILRIFNGKISCWVNNAGVFKALDYTSCLDEDWDIIMNTNLKGTVFATNNIIKYFLKNKIQGNVVNITSETADVVSTNPYALSKNALAQYTKGLAYELTSKGIRINGVAPGGVATGICGIDPNEAMNWNGIGGRLLRPEEIAEVVVFLLSDVSKCINGEIITCNEGNTLRVEYFR